MFSVPFLPEGLNPASFTPITKDETIMKSTKCAECGFVGWSDAEQAKSEKADYPENEGEDRKSFFLAFLLGVI